MIVSIRAVVLMMDPARLIALARFFGSVSAGLCTGESRPLLAAAFAAPEAVRLVKFCRWAATMNSSYRDRPLSGRDLN